MKKAGLTIVLLFASMSLSAMGLGDMRVDSFLGEPFKAEILLIDADNTPLTEIKVDLASEQEFEKAGLDRVRALSFLAFEVAKNAEGRVVIKVSSVEPMSEPYLQMLVDLAWADGQLYRSYGIFLDPPNYQLALVKKQLRQIVHRQLDADSSVEIIQPTHPQGGRRYGPTAAHETVWQIGERFKTEDVTLSQMVLAIVGTNPDAFSEGNLNGLNIGSRLKIPSNARAKDVPLVLSKEEITAHDKAWQSRQPIEHVLLPPYVNAERASPTLNTATTLFSIIPSIDFKDDYLKSEIHPLSSTLLSLSEKKLLRSKLATDKANRDVTASAIDAVRETNALLSEQLKSLQSDNKRLQIQLIKREKAMEKLHEQIRTLLLRQGLHAGVITQVPSPYRMLWFWMILLLGCVVVAAGVMVFVFQNRKTRSSPTEVMIVGPNTAKVRSKAALETLLGLAKTYIMRDDLAKAREALQEVIEFGDEEQKRQAKQLLSELKPSD